jgi:hypothetical protein
LGSSEAGTLRLSLDVVRAEVEATGKAHQNIAAQMRSELEEPLAAFAGGMKERRKIVQTGVEKLLKLKNQQTSSVNKARDKYEQDCLKIKGYLAQGHMVMGQEERKNKAKLEKTQIQLSSTSQEYEGAVKILEETTGRWNRDWKAACDKFQDLEEERIDYLKSSLWTFANIASTVCVSDDASCEKIRLSLEDCDVEKDICNFIKDNSTGQEIPDPPKFIDFCKGDINDDASDISKDDSYTVAQFPRPINPAIRSSSPQPSVLESHHDPNNPLARDFGLRQSSPAAESVRVPSQQAVRAPSQQATPTKQQPYGDPRDHRGDHRGEPRTDPRTDSQRAKNPYQQSKYAMSMGDIPQIPHDPYPMDGMTQFCRTGPPPVVGTTSDLSTASSQMSSQMRPSSRDSQSEYSNPASSYTSMESPSGHVSPIKQMSAPVRAPHPQDDEDQSPRKRGFFNSPFRRRSKHEKEQPQPTTPSNNNRNTWAPSTARKNGYGNDGRNGGSYSQANTRGTILPADSRRSYSPEPVDPRANFQLNIGNNVFDVATPDSRSRTGKSDQASASAEMDPIAQALEELKGVTKASSVRVSADRYAGLSTPAPSAAPTPLTANTALSAAQRGTPPPSYDQRGSMLGAPPAAHTARAMQETTKKYIDSKQTMFSSPQSRYHQRAQSATAVNSRPPTRGGSQSQGQEIVRATSPAPPRATSPRPGLYEQQQQQRSQQNSYSRPPSQSGYRAASPNPYASNTTSGRPRANTAASPQKPQVPYSTGSWNSRGGSPSAQQIPRATSPLPHFIPQSRPGSSRGPPPGSDMALQLAQPGGGMNNSIGSGSGSRPPSRAYYGGNENQAPYNGPAAGQISTRVRTKSFAEPAKNVTKDGRPILHYGEPSPRPQSQHQSESKSENLKTN